MTPKTNSPSRPKFAVTTSVVQDVTTSQKLDVFSLTRRACLSLALVGLILLIVLAGPTQPAHAADTCTYTIQPGDTLSSIAQGFGTSVQALAVLNRISNVNLIFVDQNLILPDCDRTAGLEDTLQFPRFLRQSTLDLSPIPEAASLAPEAGARAKSAAVRLLVTGVGDVFQGTGSVIGPNGDAILTAYHVVARPLTRQLRGDTIQLDGPEKVTAELVDVLPARDLALLRLSVDSTQPLDAVPLGESDGVQIGDTLYLVGYPAQLGGELSFEGGVVLDLLSTRQELRYIITDAYAGQGSSGGLAVNEKGELIGIVDALLTDSRALEALGYPQLDRATIVIPISQALPLLQE